MKLAKVYSHLNGHEWLLVHHREIWKEIQGIIKAIDAESYKTKISEEEGMRGKHLYSPKELNARLSRDFKGKDWKESRTSYWVTDDYNLIRRTLTMGPTEQKQEIERAGRRPIFSFNQTDFVNSAWLSKSNSANIASLRMTYS